MVSSLMILCSMFTLCSHGHYDYNNRNEGSQCFSFKATSVFKRYFSLLLPCFSLYFFCCVSCSCLLGHFGLAQALHSFAPKWIPSHIDTHIHYVLNKISDSMSHIKPYLEAIILWSCCTLLRKIWTHSENLALTDWSSLEWNYSYYEAV